jgi:hypothetical protein
MNNGQWLPKRPHACKEFHGSFIKQVCVYRMVPSVVSLLSKVLLLQSNYNRRETFKKGAQGAENKETSAVDSRLTGP